VASSLLRLGDVPLMGGEVLRLHVPQTRVLPRVTKVSLGEAPSKA